MRIGIYGGSFNPIHCGHIALARQLVDKGYVEEVWLMVSPQNPLKTGQKLLPDATRLALATKALKGEAHVKASDFEFALPRPSYTWNTLEALSTVYPQHQFSLIIGADNWQLFNEWKHPERILGHYPILVYPRRGYNINPSSLPQGATLVDMPLYDVSSTLIRTRVAQGKSISGLVPPCIVSDATQACLALLHNGTDRQQL